MCINDTKCTCNANNSSQQVIVKHKVYPCLPPLKKTFYFTLLTKSMIVEQMRGEDFMKSVFLTELKTEGYFDPLC